MVTRAYSADILGERCACRMSSAATLAGAPRDLCRITKVKPLYVVSSCHQRMPRSSSSKRKSDLLRKSNFKSTLCT